MFSSKDTLYLKLAAYNTLKAVENYVQDSK